MLVMQPLRVVRSIITYCNHVRLRRHIGRAIGIVLLTSLTAACTPGTMLSHPSSDEISSRSGTEHADAIAGGAASSEAKRRTPALGGGTIGTTIELPDTAWSGGDQSLEISTPSGGIATAVYGVGTQYSELRASFLVEAQPFGSVDLSLEGLDAPGDEKTPIAITINGQEIYNGPSQLPDGQVAAEADKWGSYTWTFDAAILKPGQNTVTLRNLATGAVNQAPFFVLDYAELTYQEK